MSYTATINFNDFILRISDILSLSPLLFPNSIGGNPSVQDLVNQIIMYEIPIPNTPPKGPGPPHIFITTSKNPIYEKKQIGRDNIDQQGPQRQTLEFWIIIVVNEKDLPTSEALMYQIFSAITTTLEQNKRLVDESHENPMSTTSTYIDVEYAIESDQRKMIAKNVVFRPQVLLNLRTE